MIRGTALLLADASVIDHIDGLYSQSALLKQIILPSLCIVICMLGLCGNGLVIFCSMFLNSNSKTCTDVYVANLAIADFIFVSTIPFWAFDLIQDEWIFGNAACRVFSFVTFLNMSSSILLLMAMAIDRYLAVVIAINSRPYRTVRNSMLCSLLVWCISIVFSLQAFAFRQVTYINNKILNKQQAHCAWLFPGEIGSEQHEFWLNVQITSRVGFAFILPLIVITYCYTSIFVFLRKRRFKENNQKSAKRQGRQFERKKQHDKSTRLVASVILIFFVCWLPNQISNLLHRIYPNWISFNLDLATSIGGNNTSTNDLEDPVQTQSSFHMVTVILAWSNSCINPLLYAFLNNSFRTRLKSLLTRRRERILASQYHSGAKLIRDTDFPNSDATNSTYLTAGGLTPKLQGSPRLGPFQLGSFLTPRTTTTASNKTEISIVTNDLRSSVKMSNLNM
ncbi:Oidioi.mRNA.OKI2018_I69.chr1.g3434.t1.cds [Oikopleura dioica]|uniref:Oidioi.mRNA.OKI2018_I69.chr1.g3434.t1.cds n=1 Tax=Oikopleura dioica TaxID=34765 RepID=A0ABN7T3A0_OIKDI|nr:Oidioi.mRNA.OKI2018_I69.chr1.g3434.t1.cds [Oikopleura dioica]